MKLSEEKIKMIKSINLLDHVIYDFARGRGQQSIREGKVTLLSLKGANVSTGYGDLFVKWCHVKSVIKKT